MIQTHSSAGIAQTPLLCPVLGRAYFYFDDGKIRESRRSEVVITQVTPFNKIDSETFEVWLKGVQERYWLYDKETDFFVKAIIQGTNNELIFVRAKGGWFSFGNFLGDGRLDVDGTLNARLNGA
jgi:hypothetical protein